MDSPSRMNVISRPHWKTLEGERGENKNPGLSSRVLTGVNGIRTRDLRLDRAAC